MKKAPALRLLPAPALGGLAVLLAVGLGLACDSATPVAPTDALIDLSVNPSRIASNGQADVTVIARKMDGFPVNEGTQITLSTNLGRLEPTELATDERGMASAVLFGNGENGMATVTAISGGVTAMAELEIGIAPVDIILSANPSSLTVPFRRNRDTKTVRLVASVADENGVPISGIRVSFETTAGLLDEDRVETNANGEARARVTVTEDDLLRAEDGFFEVTASVFTPSTGEDGGSSSITDTQEIDVLGLPTFLTLETGQSSIPAQGGAVELIATVTDDTGEPVEGAGVQFETTVGSVASRGGVVETDRNGQAFDVLSASEQDLASVTTNVFTVSAQIAGTASMTGETFDTATIAIQDRAPIPGFTASVNCTTVTFTNTTTPSLAMDPSLTFEWNFGNGVILPGVENPIIQYGMVGTFMVTLTVTSSASLEPNSVTIPVTTLDTPTGTFTSGVNGMTASFDASMSTGTNLMYAWAFGDGGTDTGVMTSHTYATSGTFDVELTVTATNPQGVCVGSPVTQPVVIP